MLKKQHNATINNFMNSHRNRNILINLDSYTLLTVYSAVFFTGLGLIQVCEKHFVSHLNTLLQKHYYLGVYEHKYPDKIFTCDLGYLTVNMFHFKNEH